MVAIAITRMDLTAAALRSASAKSRDAQAARRMLALALVLEGRGPEDCGADLRDGPADAQGLGASLQRLKGWPGCRTIGARRGHDGSLPVRCPNSWPGWRRVPIRRWTGWCAGGDRTCNGGSLPVSGVELHERTVGKYLAGLGYRRLSVRPRHPKTEPEAQEAFKKTSPRR